VDDGWLLVRRAIIGSELTDMPESGNPAVNAADFWEVQGMHIRRSSLRLLTAILVGIGTVLVGTGILATAPLTASASITYAETTGGVVHTWADYADAGGTEGPEIGSNATVQITCRVSGWEAPDGNTWWYEIASSPWSNSYYGSADAFYNNGQTSGSLHGTPFYDPNVPVCGSTAPTPTTYGETTGGVVHTWADYADAGGTEGPEIGSNVTVQIACRVSGWEAPDGNTWWYEIASSPWSNSYYGSADAFYNNGETSGSLVGTPFVDPAVPLCNGSGNGGSGSKPSPTVLLAQGPPAPAGYRYAITLSGFPVSTTVSVTCYDSVSTSGFYTFSLATDSSGSAFTESYCYSGDGPEHWVVAGGVESNQVAWGPGSSPPPPPSTTTTTTTTTPPATTTTTTISTPPVTGPIGVAESDNWAGYDVLATGVTYLRSSWSVPSVSCSSTPKASAVAIWGGIDDQADHLVQAGTEAYCLTSTSKPIYFSWWESLPAGDEPVAYVNPGDRISLTLTYQNGAVVILLTDDGAVNITKTVAAPNEPRSEAECIVEAPTHTRVIFHLKEAHPTQLANFQRATFTDCAVSASNGLVNREMALGGADGATVTRIVMTDWRRDKASTGLPGAGGVPWTVSWRNPD
jgi:hypothetical protein